MVNHKREKWLKNLASAQDRASGNRPAGGDDDSGEAVPSRSQLKRESAALQVLGEELCKLPSHVLRDLGVDEALREAVAAWQNTKSREGKRRQMQYVGRLMRDMDTRELFRAWQAFNADGAAAAKRLQEVEALRQKLIDDEPDAWAEVFSRCPDIDKQALEELIREARSERATGKPPRAFRAVFRLLRAAEGERP